MRKILIWLLIASSAVIANPNGENLVYGKVNFDRQGNTLNVVQKTNTAIIDWLDFAIDTNETTNFVQPSQYSSCLNRVVGNLSTEILGTLHSNGDIFLINPNGIIVGNTGVVDTGSFVASTLNVSNQDFLNGNLSFTGGDRGKIINNGQIYAKDLGVVLVAPVVKNNGTISTNGNVWIAAGKMVILSSPKEGEQLDLSAHPIAIRVKYDKAYIENNGTIKANALFCSAFIDNPEYLAINLNGTVNTTSTDVPTILLGGNGAVDIGAKMTDPDGFLIAAGSSINVKQGAQIDLSGSQGLGFVSIGIDQYLSNVYNLPVTEFINIEKGALVKACGNSWWSNGGSIVLSCMDSMNITGKVLATGGSILGNGGEIVLYSLIQPQISGKLDVSATIGDDGKILINP